MDDSDMHGGHDHPQAQENMEGDALPPSTDQWSDIGTGGGIAQPIGEPESSNSQATTEMPDIQHHNVDLGPLNVEIREVDSGGVLPESLSVALHQLNINLDTDALQSQLSVTHAGADSDTASIGGLSADATVTLLSRYDVVAHAEGADVAKMLDYMREGRPVILAVARSEFWSTVDDRGEGGAHEAVRIGEWRSDSENVELVSAANPDVALYEISKTAFVGRWREQETSLVVVDDGGGRTGPLPVLLPLVLDAAAGLQEVSAD